MVMSTILQHPDAPERRLAVSIGRELRRRRLAARLSQAAIGDPFTRAFVCAVERGRALPSIASLGVLLGHLGVAFDEFFQGVQQDMTSEYTGDHEDHTHTSSRRRR